MSIPKTLTPESLAEKLRVHSTWAGKKLGRCIKIAQTDGVYWTELTQAEVFDLIDCLLKWSAENQDRKRECSRIDS
jgi:hypothetical protein